MQSHDSFDIDSFLYSSPSYNTSSDETSFVDDLPRLETPSPYYGSLSSPSASPSLRPSPSYLPASPAFSPGRRGSDSSSVNGMAYGTIGSVEPGNVDGSGQDILFKFFEDLDSMMDGSIKRDGDDYGGHALSGYHHGAAAYHHQYPQKYPAQQQSEHLTATAQPSGDYYYDNASPYTLRHPSMHTPASVAPQQFAVHSPMVEDTTHQQQQSYFDTSSTPHYASSHTPSGYHQSALFAPISYTHPTAPFPSPSIASTTSTSTYQSSSSHPQSSSFTSSSSSLYPPPPLPTSRHSASAGPPKVHKHACMECTKTFARRQDLRRHETTHRPGVKPFKCVNCKTGFTRSDALHRHQKAKRCGDLAARE